MTATASAVALETRGLHKRFGGLEVVRSLSFNLAPGARHALIGPNGAGKTTVVNLVAGALAPSDGAIFLHGRDITGLAQAARVKRGIVRTFQISQLFRNLTVLENVGLALAERDGIARVLWRGLDRFPTIVAEAMALLDSLGLGPAARAPVRSLAYGRQRLVEIAIALALKPNVLLLDEPAAGIPSAESHVILGALDRLPPAIAVLIIDHDMGVVFRFARRITVLVGGIALAEGSPAEIAADPRVRAAYLGEAALPEGAAR
jgi:ABC-type branched-subunit amino acid transport system ATPase component